MKGAAPVRLAIVGCGAMSELGHLPALQALIPTVLIDPDESRARSLARKFGVPHHSTSLADAAQWAEAACVVVPHHVHASVALELIALGLHVLIEKPLAITLTDCDAIIAAARANNVVLAVAMVRRFARTTKYLKAAIDQGSFGAARTFRLVSGVAGVWPTKSAYLLNPEQSGGGVLMSNGVHDLDLLAYLFGQPEQVNFFADADFGRARRMESDVRIEMSMRSSVNGVVELSRTRDLANGLWIEFEHASLYSPLAGDEVSLTLRNGETLRLSGRLTDDGANSQTAQTLNDMLTNQLDDFAAAVNGLKAPMADGSEGRRAIETITRCYANVTPLDLPWRQPVFVPEAP